MASRTVELIFRTLTDDAAESVAKLRKELEELKKLQDDDLKLPETFKQIKDDVDDATEKIGGGSGLIKAFDKLNGVVGFIGQNFLGLKSAIQTAIGVGQQFYNTFIGSNEQLNQELLKSQANLAATSRITIGGVEVTDPLEAVRATRDELESSLKVLEVETAELVGVTSEDVTAIYNAVLSNSGAISTQLKSAKKEGLAFNSAIEASVPLAKNLTAALGVLNIDKSQAQLEIRDLLTGNVTSDSAVAKALGISNTEIKRLQAQGTLVESVIDRLEPFAAANAEAARSVSGLSSNILDVFQIISREVGKPLLEPIVSSLAAVERVLAQNKIALIDYFGFFGKAIASAVEQIKSSIGPAVASILEIAQSAAPEFQAAFSAIARLFGEIGGLIGDVISAVFGLTAQTNVVDSFATAVEAVALSLTDVVITVRAVVGALEPVVGLIGNILAPIFEFASSDAGQIVIQTIATIATGFAAYQGLVAGVVALKAAAIALIPAATAATGSLTAMAAAAAAAAAPLAIFAAAIATIVIVRKTKELEDFNEAVEATNRAVQAASDGIGQSAFADATALKELNALEVKLSKTGKELTEQDKERQELLRQRTELNIEGIEAAISDLEAQKGESPERDKLLDAQIKSLERQKNALESVTGGGLGLYNRALEDLGKTQEKLAQDAEGQRARIFGGEDGLGPQVRTTEDLTAATKEYLGTLSQQEGLGFISSDFAVSELEKIRDNTQQSIESRQAAADQIEKIEKARNQNELAGIKNQQQNISTLLSERQITEVDAAKRLNEAKQAELSEQITDTQQEIERLKAAGATSNSPQVRALVQQERELQLQLRGVVVEGINEQQKLKQQSDKLELDNLKQQTQEVETLLAERRITEEEAARRTTEGKKAELNEQLKDVQEQIANLRAQGANEESFEFQELVQQEEQLQLEIRNAEVQGIKERERLKQEADKLELDAIRRQQAEIEALTAEGELGIVESVQRSTEARKAELDEQLKDIIEQQKAITDAGGTTESNEFKALVEQQKQLEADRRKLVVENEKAIQEARLKELQLAQDKALDQVKLAETERLIEIQRLNAGEVEGRINIEDEKLELTRSRIEKELELEQERIAFLESQRGTGSQEDQLQREDEIREARLKTADLTTQLLENEQQQQQRLYDKQLSAIDRAQQAEKNRTDVAVQGLEQQSAQLDALNRTYERQISLLQEEQNLRGAINGFYQSQKGLLAQINQELGRDKEAAKIREQAAEMAVKQLKEQQKLEDLILEQQIRQNEILLEQEIIQNRINQARAKAEAAQARADLQKAQVELQKVIADPNSSQGDIESASLNVDAAAIGVTAAQEAVRGFQIEAGFLQDKRDSLDSQSAAQRQQNEIRQRQELRQTEFEAAQAQNTEGEKRRGLRQLRSRVQSDLNDPSLTEPVFRAPRRRVDEQGVREAAETYSETAHRLFQEEFGRLVQERGLQSDDIEGRRVAFREAADYARQNNTESPVQTGFGEQPATEIPTASGGMEMLATESAKQTGILTAINEGIGRLQSLVPELNVTFNNQYGAGQTRQAANDAEQMIVQSIRELSGQIA